MEPDSEASTTSFDCPITLAVMTDPVCDKEGNTFERSAITEWINLHGCSPITRSPMTLDDLVPNRALKSMIEQGHSVLMSTVTAENKLETQVYSEDPNLTVHTVLQDSKLLVSVDPGNTTVRSKVKVVCVIDVSGSMGCEAQVPGDKTGAEACGLTILDVVRHAVITIVKSLTQHDSLALVTFADSGEVVLPLTKMNSAGQRKAIQTVTSLISTSSTNLWAGLEMGLEVLAEHTTATDPAISAVLLFTDGEPNIIPPRGHIPMLQMYKDRHGGMLPGILNTFGFGYGMDSQLLYDLSREGNGTYAFIPDSGMVGTIFVHAVANLISTVATDCQLTVEPMNGTRFVASRNTLGPYLVSDERWGVLANVGTLQAGQSKDVFLALEYLPSPGKDCIKISLQAKTRTNACFKIAVIAQNCVDRQPSTKLLHTVQRFAFVGVIEHLKNLMQASNNDEQGTLFLNASIKKLRDDLNGSTAPAEVIALWADLEGQVNESLDPTAYAKWGRHYLPSLMTAHLYQICNNFKDPGPQVYGGLLFKTLRDQADALFLTLPPPKPTIKRASNRPVSMSRYNDSRGVCFHGDGLILLANGTRKVVRAVEHGDKVVTTDGNTAEIQCVVQTITSEPDVDLVTVPGSNLMVTPWHPIRIEKNWIFPITVAEPQKLPCPILYNFVLSTGHIVNINGVEGVTLGHGLTDEVCSHDYFGTQKVIKDLREMTEFDKGIVKISGVMRDSQTNHVISLIQYEE